MVVRPRSSHPTWLLALTVLVGLCLLWAPAVVGQQISPSRASTPVDAAVAFTGGQAFTGSTADVTTLSRGTNAQQFRVYGSTTGPKYVEFGTDATNAFVRASGFSGGTLFIDSGAGNGLELGVNGTRIFSVGGTGMIPATASPNTYDVGSASRSMRTGYFGTSVVVGTTTLGSLSNAGSGTRYLCINTSGVIASSATACSGTDPETENHTLSADEYAEYQELRRLLPALRQLIAQSPPIERGQ